MRALPPDGGAEVWTIDLDRSVDTSCLSADEAARAAHFHQATHGRRFAAGRAALRSLLARYVDVAPASLVFAYGLHGKPSLVDSQVGFNVLHFNVAHTGAIAMIAIADAPVGIDVEPIASNLDIQAVGEIAFAPDEIAVLRHIPPDVRARAFTKVWTSREAFVKGLGLGLSMSPTAIKVCADPASPPSLLRGGAGWRLEHLDAPPGHVATLAVAAGAGRTTQRRWPETQG